MSLMASKAIVRNWEFIPSVRRRVRHLSGEVFGTLCILKPHSGPSVQTIAQVSQGPREGAGRLAERPQSV